MKFVRNIQELANYLGLSVTTVSRVLNGKSEQYRISKKTSEKVIRAAQELNYMPNNLARGLKLAKTNTLGVVIPDIGNPFFADIAKIIEQEALKNNYFIILCDSEENQKTEVELIQLLLSRKVDGLIIAPVGIESEHIARLYHSKFPVVIIDRYFPDLPIPYITSDNYQGAYEAVQYLIQTNHKRIACIQGLPSSQPGRERVQGYIEALKNNRMSVEQELIVGDSFSEENGYVSAQLLFSLKNPPDAIFACSNLIALGVLRAAREKGYKIPDMFSLIAFDEQPFSAYLVPSMTTVEQQKKEMGRLAVKFLIQFIQNQGFDSKVAIKLKTRLHIRESVNRL